MQYMYILKMVKKKKNRYIHILKKISINKKKNYYQRNVCSEKVND